jgi:hypothetical protein
VQAATALRWAGTRNEAQALLALAEPVAVRRAALGALGALGENAQSAARIAAWLNNEPDPEARKDALDALAETGGVTYEKIFLDRMWQRNLDPDAAVRDHAWVAFRRLLPGAKTTDLVRWTNRNEFRKDDPVARARRVEILEVLCQKLRAAGNGKDLALQQQNLGRDTFRLKQFKKAAASYREAAEFWRGQDVWPRGVMTVFRPLLESYAKDKNYDALVEAAEELHDAAPPLHKGEIAQALNLVIYLEARQLFEGEQFDDASRLIERARSMKIPLDRETDQDLQEIKSRIDSRSGGGDGAAGE